jgi:hypothetical protein
VSDDQHSRRRPAPPRNVLPDFIIPALALAFAIYYLTTITEVPWSAQASAVLVSALLLLSIVVYVIRTLWRVRAGIETVRWQGFSSDPRNDLRRVGLLALSIGYVWFISDLGFTIATTAFLFLAIVLLSSPANWKNAAVIAVLSSLIGYFVFIFIFETRFPSGPFEKAIAPYARSVKKAFDDG